MTNSIKGNRTAAPEIPEIPYERMTAAAAIRLAAVHTWPAAVCPVLFGIFWCLQRGIYLSPAQAILLAAACVLSQSSVNTLNDYVDFVSGADSEKDNVEVNDAVLIYYRVNPGHALALGIIYLISAGNFHPEILPECLPLILGIALIMLSNNGSDIEKDIAAQRATLPVLLGREKALILYRVMLAVWIALLCIQPLTRLGKIGFLSIVLTLILGRRPFGFLIRARLLPGDRIRQMKSVTAANLIGNGLLGLAYAAAWFLQLPG